MPTFRVPLTVKTEITITCETAEHAELHARTLGRQAFPVCDALEIDTDTPEKKSAYEVTICVYLDAFSTQEAEAEVFDLLGPVFNGNKKFGYDVEKINKEGE